MRLLAISDAYIPAAIIQDGLEPLRELDVANLSVSSDTFHEGETDDPRPGFVVQAARGRAEAFLLRRGSPAKKDGIRV